LCATKDLAIEPKTDPPLELWNDIMIVHAKWPAYTAGELARIAIYGWGVWEFPKYKHTVDDPGGWRVPGHPMLFQNEADARALMLINQVGGRGIG